MRQKELGAGDSTGVRVDHVQNKQPNKKHVGSQVKRMMPGKQTIMQRTLAPFSSILVFILILYFI